MSTWKLKDCYLMVDMERLNYDQYFQKDFKCPELDEFFSEITSSKKISQNKNNINQFFEKLIDINNYYKSLYIRFKWLAYLHSLLKLFDHDSMMFTYIMKALHIYLEKLPVIQQKYGAYEQYLANNLFRPYIQYLIKLCLLNLDEEDSNKQNYSQDYSQNNINIGSPLIHSKWYRYYNFVHWSGQTFSGILNEVKNFFCLKYPYLNQIGSQIYRDIKNMIPDLKANYKSLKELNVSLMELDKLEEKIQQFYQNNTCFIARDQQYLCSEVKDYSKADVSDFLISPMKEINTTSASIKVHSPFTIQEKQWSQN